MIVSIKPERATRSEALSAYVDYEFYTLRQHDKYINNKTTPIQRPPLQGARQRRDEQPDRERSGARRYVAADRPPFRGNNRPI